MFSLFKPNKEKSESYLDAMRALFSTLVEGDYEVVYANYFEERKGIVAKTSLYHNYILGYNVQREALALVQMDTALNAVGEPILIHKSEIVKAKVTLAKACLVKTAQKELVFNVPQFVTPVAGVLFYPIRQESAAKAFKEFFKEKIVTK